MKNPNPDITVLNVIEAENKLGRSITSYQAIEESAHSLLALGTKNVLLTGRQIKDALFSQDYWTNGSESFWIANQRYIEKKYIGKHRTLSFAINVALSLGYSIKDAIVLAKMYTNRGIRLAHHIDQHTATFLHDGFPEHQDDLPYLALNPIKALAKPFRPFQTGLYPVVDSSRWLEKLLPLGVKCIQLRVKNTDKSILAEEIKQSVLLAKKYGAILFVNDYWDLAIDLGADGVHLGQEDLLEADIQRIHAAGLYLGVSTHCYYEVARAHTLHPSYIAYGPIYPTTSKIMAFQPQGTEQLKRWRQTLHYPLVAIGGISLERLPLVLQTGVHGIALISAITQAHDPTVATQQFMQRINAFSESKPMA